jgi:hypothetical protein
MIALSLIFGLFSNSFYELSITYRGPTPRKYFNIEIGFYQRNDQAVKFYRAKNSFLHLGLPFIEYRGMHLQKCAQRQK